ncbi:MAG: aminotransferase class III-fold pyridoxal phosphate-dependent enzyme, partial [Acidimicrobiales bacterium]
ANPHVVAAMAQQASTVDYVHATQFQNQPLARFADRLARLAPVHDNAIFTVSGGSEANETAIKMARAYHVATGSPDRHIIIARHGAYHGNSRGALDASDRAALRSGYEPWLGHTVKIASANVYRSDWTAADHANELAATIAAVGSERVAALIAEPISGATLAGAMPPDGYWPALASVCADHGVLLIADEVMTGFGRTGRLFAMQHWGVTPDIITCGKGASSGYWPLGLVIADGRIQAAIDANGGFNHGFTRSHHPLGAAVANAVLDVIEDERLVETCQAKGESLRSQLRSQLADHPHVGDIRGLGLLTGVEFVADRSTKEPFDRSLTVSERIVAAAFARGLTVYPCTSAVDGNVGDAILIGPPLTVDEPTIATIAQTATAAIRGELGDA